jgi:hypothetical protein
MEGVGQTIVADIPAFRRARHGQTLGREDHQPFVQVVDDVGFGDARRFMEIERLRLGAVAAMQDLLGLRRERGAQNQGAGQHCRAQAFP